MDWSMRVICSIFGICVWDSWMAFSGCKKVRCTLKQASFYMLPYEDLIDNTTESIGLKARMRTADESDAMTMIDDTSKRGIGAHLIPTKRLTKKNKGEKIGGRRVCKTGKTTLEFSVCRYENHNDQEVWLSTTRIVSKCFSRHITKQHKV